MCAFLSTVGCLFYIDIFPVLAVTVGYYARVYYCIFLYEKLNELSFLLLFMFILCNSWVVTLIIDNISIYSRYHIDTIYSRYHSILV